MHCPIGFAGRLWRAAFLAAVFCVPVVPVSAQDAGGDQAAGGGGGGAPPVMQYSVAFVFGGLAFWAVLRPSRRGWSEGRRR
jgi:hypothetical protein